MAGRETMRRNEKGEIFEGDLCKKYQKSWRRRKEIRRRRSDTEASTRSVKRTRNHCNTTSSSSLSSSSSSPQSSTTMSEPSDSDGDAQENVASTCVSHGSVSIIGRRREMEDAVTVLPRIVPRHDFFGVYDGHGGGQVAAACRERMHVVLGDVAGGHWPKGDEGRWREVMGVCFARVDEEVSAAAAAAKADAAEKTVGSTAVVAVVGPSEIVVANCGDSRAVLSRGGVAVPLSEDHKPDRPDEMERVEAAGGRVINWNGYRVLGVLATSRSIGDYYLKPYVTAEPEVTVTTRTEKDEFLILASDGLWDVISNEVACKITRRCLSGRAARIFPEAIGGSSASEAAAFLAELAMSRGSRDNISVVVVQLKRLNSETSNGNS